MNMIPLLPSRTYFLAAVLAMAAAVLPQTLAVGQASAQSSAPSVAASIGPIHSLVQMVLGRHGEVGLLMEPGESAHGAAFRPSQRRMIGNAALVFIVDPEYERHLAKPLDGHAGMVALARSPGLELLPGRQGLRFRASDDGHGLKKGRGPGERRHGHHKRHAHSHGPKDHKDEDHDAHGHSDQGRDQKDLHVWLDPRNAVLMVRSIEAELTKLMPEHKADFAANTKAAVAMLLDLDAETEARMEAARHIRFINFHDAYQYFERRYGLTVPATVLDLHVGSISAARLRELERIMREEKVDCIFTEPQFDARLVDVLQRSGNAKRSELDPLGSSVAPGPDFYPALIRAMADSIEDCIGR